MSPARKVEPDALQSTDDPPQRPNYSTPGGRLRAPSCSPVRGGQSLRMTMIGPALMLVRTFMAQCSTRIQGPALTLVLTFMALLRG